MSRSLRLLVLVLLFIAAGRAWPQTEPIPDAEARSIRAVIEAQLSAFSTDDAVKAFSFASEGIQKTFGSAENFIEMVKASYAVVYRPASVLFLKPERVADETLQTVQMSDEQGQVWLALYRMQRQPDDSWRIGGCVLKLLQSSST